MLLQIIEISLVALGSLVAVPATVLYAFTVTH